MVHNCDQEAQSTHKKRLTRHLSAGPKTQKKRLTRHLSAGPKMQKKLFQSMEIPIKKLSLKLPVTLLETYESNIKYYHCK